MAIKQEELQFLHLIGIYKEAYKVMIFSWKKIFSQITYVFILPISFVFIANMKVSNALFAKITDVVRQAQTQSQVVLEHIEPSHPDFTGFGWDQLLFFKAGYITFLLLFSPLPTAAIVYTIACIYTRREVTFRKVVRFVPKVWTRLVITSFCAFVAIFAYTMVILVIIALISITGNRNILVPAVVLLLLFFMGFVYISIIWQTASIVSILEEEYGIKAIIKSKAVVKGKTGWEMAIIFLTMNTSYVIMKIAFSRVVDESSLGRASRGLYGIICFLLLVLLILYELVVQSVTYFVCKSHHLESIDKSPHIGSPYEKDRGCS